MASAPSSTRPPAPAGLRYVLVAPVVLFAVAGSATPLIDSGQLFAIGCALGLAGTIAFLAAGPWRLSPLYALAALGAFCCLGAAIAIWVNRAFDTARPTGYSTHVTDKIERSHGRRRARGPYLVLAPWGPVVTPYRLSVNGGVYAAAAIGDRVCINLHPGALGARWYRADPCPG